MTDEKNTQKDNRPFRQRHPYTSKALVIGAAALIGLSAYGIATWDRYPTLAKGRVIEEKWIEEKDAKQEEVKARHYVLNLHLDDRVAGRGLDKICTLYVSEDSQMPRAVLDDVVNNGSEVYLPYLEPGWVLGDPEPRYKIACFGRLGSSELRVVHPWESSEKVRKEFEGEIEQRIRKERQEAHNEMMEAAYEDFTVDAFF